MLTGRDGGGWLSVLIAALSFRFWIMDVAADVLIRVTKNPGAQMAGVLLRGVCCGLGLAICALYLVARWTGLAVYESGAVIALFYDLLAIESAASMLARLPKLCAKCWKLARR